MKPVLTRCVRPTCRRRFEYPFRKQQSSVPNRCSKISWRGNASSRRPVERPTVARLGTGDASGNMMGRFSCAPVAVPIGVSPDAKLLIRDIFSTMCSNKAEMSLMFHVSHRTSASSSAVVQRLTCVHSLWTAVEQSARHTRSTQYGSDVAGTGFFESSKLVPATLVVSVLSKNCSPRTPRPLATCDFRH